MLPSECRYTFPVPRKTIPSMTAENNAPNPSSRKSFCGCFIAHEVVWLNGIGVLVLFYSAVSIQFNNKSATPMLFFSLNQSFSTPSALDSSWAVAEVLLCYNLVCSQCIPLSIAQSTQLYHFYFLS